MSVFGYLKKYKQNEKERENSFYFVSQKNIQETEERLGYELPSQLKDFYETIGYGFFAHNKDFSVVETSYSSRLMDPDSVIDIKMLGYESGQILPSVEFEADELPFFEVDGGDMFFVMKPESANPNAVYQFMGGEMIEESFEKFIWRLYHESPIYYMKDWGAGIEDETEE